MFLGVQIYFKMRLYLFVYLFTYFLPHTDFRLCFLLVIIAWAKVTVT